MTLTIEQLITACDFAGIVIDIEKTISGKEKKSFMATEFTFNNEQKFNLESGNIYDGKTVHCTEYPEEGFFPLDETNQNNRV